MINGFFPLTKGEIFFDGKQVSGLKTHQIRKAGIGRISQVVKPLKRMIILDRILAGNHGTAIAEGSPEEAAANQEIIAAYLRRRLWSSQ